METDNLFAADLCGEFQRLRRSRGKIIADQARALGFSVSYISSVESGDEPMPPDYVEHFSSWLALTPQEVTQLLENCQRTSRRARRSSAAVRKYIPLDIKQIRSLQLVRKNC
jgi:hypothetical protein